MGFSRLFLPARFRTPVRLSVVFFILCSFFIFLTGCTDFRGEDWIESRNIPEADDSKIISNYDLQSYVPAPVEGQEALMFLIQGNLEVTVAWQHNDGEELESFFFIDGVVYQADITMKTKNGYTFDPEKSFKYYTVPVNDQPEDNFDTAFRKLSVTYLSVPATENRKKLVSNYDLQYYVPVPTTKGTPVKQITRGDMYGTVSWMEVTGDDAVELPEEPFESFKGDTVYRAEITLRVHNDYLFDQDMSFYYPYGSVGSQEIMESDESSELVRKLSVTYKPTVKAAVLGGLPETSIDLAEIIPLPVAGEYPPPVVNDQEGGDGGNSRFTGVILWTPQDSPFEAGEEYSATVMLYTTSGYEFAEGCNIKYTGVNDVMVSHSDGTIVLVNLEFPPAADAPGE
jgi:hypothetical protein